MIYKLNNTSKVNNIFNNWNESLIWSCQDKIMGEIYVDNLTSPTSALAINADFCFYAGIPNKELIEFTIEHYNKFLILTPQNNFWSNLIENTLKGKIIKTKRYAIKKEGNIFNKEKLQNIINTIPYEYELKLINEELYTKCKAEHWSYDLVSQFPNYSSYKNLGLGVVVLKDGIIISGASSYTRYKKGIEIEIDTEKAYRRKGLATACGAKLILECLKRDLYPSWDAQNLWSVALAEKLGYHFSHEYTVYEYTPS